MNAQLDLMFGRKLKQRGMDFAAGNRNRLLVDAQNLARAIARGKGTCSANDVANAMERHGLDYYALGPAAGSVFKGAHWAFTGEWIESTRPARHAGMIRVWKLKDAA